MRLLVSRLAALVPLALAVAGCNEDPSADNGKGDHIPTTVVKSTVAYPAGPYNFTQGSILEGDLFIQGFADAQAAGATVQKLFISDFYNPHGRDPSYHPGPGEEDDTLFPADSPYARAGNLKKPVALLIDVASVWCVPCNEEAKMLLNGLYAKYHPCGGDFLFILAEGAAPGTPVTESLLDTWTSKYKVAYPAGYDAGKNLSGLYPSNSFPDGAIVDTTTMTIAKVITGVPDDSFWSTYESLLEPTCVAAH